jgi:hypothetical protein
VRASLSRFAAVVLAILAIAGCSSAAFTRLAYNNAALAYSNLGPMLTWIVDDYVDIEGSREDWVRVRIERVLAWHRSEELPRYRELLETMLAKSVRAYRVEDIAAHQKALRAAYHRVVGQVIPDTAEFMAGMDSSEIERMEKKFAEDNRQFAKEALRGSPEARLERRMKRFIGHLESWVGSLTSEQRELVASRYPTLTDVSEELMAERRSRQEQLLALARARPPRPQIEATLRRIFIETDSWRRPEYAAKLRERDQQLGSMISELSATLTDEQRAHLQKRIRRFLGDISTLTASNAGQKTGTWSQAPGARTDQSLRLKSSVAWTSRERMPGSKAECPASCAITYSASGQALCRSSAETGGHTMS